MGSNVIRNRSDITGRRRMRPVAHLHFEHAGLTVWPHRLRISSLGSTSRRNAAVQRSGVDQWAEDGTPSGNRGSERLLTSGKSHNRKLTHYCRPGWEGVKGVGKFGVSS